MMLKSHKSKMGVIYICNHENNVPSRLSPQWLYGNSCTWAYDVRFIYIYNKIRRATDIINHSSSERRSIFNASRCLKLPIVTVCFTACIGAHSRAIDLDNVIISQIIFQMIFKMIMVVMTVIMMIMVVIIMIIMM